MQGPVAAYPRSILARGAMNRCLSIALGLVLVGLACEPASAVCAPFVRWVNNQTVDNYMTVRSGKTCSLIFRSGGPTYQTVILVRPSHGTVSVGDVGRVIYRARLGYIGADTFTYARRGLDSRNGPMNATVRIAVTVTP
jgi:hypothetical protein